MKSKRLIRFYFAADELNCALDNLILQNACNTRDFVRGGEFYAERIIEIIEIKSELGRLWNYLDKVMEGFGEGERLSFTARRGRELKNSPTTGAGRLKGR